MFSISFARQSKTAFFPQLVEPLNDWCKRWQREFFELPPGSFEAIQCTQQPRRRTRNCFGGEGFEFVRPIFHFACGDCEQQVEMFRARTRRLVFPCEQCS